MLEDNTNAKLWSLFDSIKDEKTMIATKGIMESKQKSILIIDSYNTFIRCYMSIPTLNEDGLHTGGISGFFKSVGYAIKMFRPDKCIFVFDGLDGSVKRRKIYPEYKNKRKTKIRLNRIYEENTSLGEEDISLKRQFQRIVVYLQHLPVYFLSINGIEADDTIAYLALDYYKDYKTTIMSSDKDFMQLVNDNIRIWSPTKKKIYTPQDVLTEYGIIPENFVYFKCLMGDVSDNIAGIRGCGPKTIIKALPLLSAGPADLNQIKEYCQKNIGDLKVYTSILDNWDIVERNYSLIQLTDTYVNTISQLSIKEVLDKSPPKFEPNLLAKLILNDKLWGSFSNYRIWVEECFRHLDKK